MDIFGIAIGFVSGGGILLALNQLYLWREVARRDQVERELRELGARLAAEHAIPRKIGHELDRWNWKHARGQA